MTAVLFRRRAAPRLIATACTALLTASGEVRGQSTFTLGSPASAVRRAQGAPSVIERLHSLGLEIWTYGSATVRLSSDSMKVIGWENGARTLRIAMSAGPNATNATTLGAGSHADDVVRLMGIPAAVREDRARGTMTWRYGASTVSIGLADRRVVAWTNAGGNLVVRPRAEPAALEPGGAAPGSRSTVASGPDAPVTIDMAVAFREPSGNGALDGGESATLSVEVRNRGPGTAHGVRVVAAQDSGADRIAIGTAPVIPRLAAGAAARVDIPVAAPIEARDGQFTLGVVATEANGFNVDAPRRLTVTVRAARPPKLALAGVRVDDQSGDGRVAPRELADVTVRVWNGGTGTARDVRATITPGDDTFLVEESARELTLGTILPAEHRDLSFALYTNSRAREARVVITLTESTGRFGATLAVPISIDRPIAQTLDVPLPEPSRADSAPAVPASLLDEVERDIPRAAQANPDAIAVVIGVERYATLPPARFAARDAQLFRRYAASAFGVPDDRNHLYVRTDADATGNEFRKLFGDDGWLARRVQPTTDLYVFFSGHGAPDLKTRTPYLLPSDADAAYPRETGVALNALYQQLAKLDVRSVTVFLDACFTGATRSSGTLFSGARPIVISVEQPALLRDNFAVIAAAGSDQIASEYPAKRHGLFTYFAMLGLRGAADADADGAVTVGELERYLGGHVPGVAAQLDREQKPVVIARNKDRAIVRFGGAR
jgi:hypothetical protein